MGDMERRNVPLDERFGEVRKDWVSEIRKLRIERSNWDRQRLNTNLEVGIREHNYKSVVNYVTTQLVNSCQPAPASTFKFS